MKIRSLACSALTLAAVLSAVGCVAQEEKSVEEKLGVHRAQSDDTAPYDAFAYLNRIQLAPGEDQPAADYAGIILYSRLPNEEGRIQLKVVEGFDRAAYLGYKTFLRAWDDGSGLSIGACVMCHMPADFTDNAEHIVDLTGEPAMTAPLRNLLKNDDELEAAVRKKIEMAAKSHEAGSNIDETYKLISLKEEDVANLVAFIKSVRELPAEEYREIVVGAEILDTSDMQL